MFGIGPKIGSYIDIRTGKFKHGFHNGTGFGLGTPIGYDADEEREKAAKRRREEEDRRRRK